MMQTNVPEINIDELMEKIRAEVKERKAKGTISPASNSRNCCIPSSLGGKIGLAEVSPVPDTEKFEIKDHYHISDFLKFRDRNFVIIAYRGILRRSPIQVALSIFLPLFVPVR